ncbi:MAG: fibronectin type III domain-containing protein [Candidatus Eisenbacteria bacterium]|nr:fibronectin type III domain-containing protein [Candidatus Eisenbacteria bacterium]
MRKTAGYGAIAAALLALIAFAGCDDDNVTEVVHVYHTVPPVPVGVFTVTGDRSVQVYWEPARGVGDVTYGVYRSTEPLGDYYLVGTVVGAENTYFFDNDVELENGVTYFYAVDASNQYGESDLSYEEVADTPRPQGVGLRLYWDGYDPESAGLDFSEIQRGGDAGDMVVAWDDDLCDVYLIVVDDLFRLVPAFVEEEGETYPNDIQDFGYTYDFDEISFAPLEGWSLDPYGVELIEGHTYVIWTWDDHFAKLRVVSIGENHVVLEWAYQISNDDIERRQLAPNFDRLFRKS